MTDTNVPSVPGLGDIHDGERALREVMPEIQALPADKVRKPNVSATVAAAIAAGAFDHIAFFRDAIREELPRFDLRNIDRLKLYTLAAWHTASTQRTSGAPTTFDDLIHDATELFEDLGAAATPLIRKKLVNPAKFVRTGTSFRALADDLNSRVSGLRERRADIEGKTTVTEEDLERGADFAGRIVLEIENSVNPMPTSETDLRYRAWTLFENAYEACRRAIQYLRYEQGDADKFIPPLRQQAKGRRDPAEKNEPTKADDATDTTNVEATTSPRVNAPTAAPVVPVSTGKPIGGDDADGPFVKEPKK